MADTATLGAVMREWHKTHYGRNSYTPSSAQVQFVLFDEADIYPQEDPTMNKLDNATAGMLLDDAIEATDEHAKALRKQRKANAKRARKLAAIAAEKARIRAVVKYTLERECDRGADPVVAAVELARLFA